jgi:hypothetical protein
MVLGAISLAMVQMAVVAAAVVVQVVVNPVAVAVSFLDLLVAGEAALGYWGQALRELEVFSVVERGRVVVVAAAAITAALRSIQVAQEPVGSGVMVVLLAVAAAQVVVGLSALAPLLGEEEVMAVAVQSV